MSRFKFLWGKRPDFRITDWSWCSCHQWFHSNNTSDVWFNSAHHAQFASEFTSKGLVRYRENRMLNGVFLNQNIQNVLSMTSTFSCLYADHKHFFWMNWPHPLTLRLGRFDFRFTSRIAKVSVSPPSEFTEDLDKADTAAFLLYKNTQFKVTEDHLRGAFQLAECGASWQAPVLARSLDTQSCSLRAGVLQLFDPTSDLPWKLMWNTWCQVDKKQVWFVKCQGGSNTCRTLALKEQN